MIKRDEEAKNQKKQSISDLRRRSPLPVLAEVCFDIALRQNVPANIIYQKVEGTLVGCGHAFKPTVVQIVHPLSREREEKES
jgi:hypothetical protein